MRIENRAKYCVFYLGTDGELIIREDIGVDDLAKILKEAEEATTEDEVISFNMKGITELPNLLNHPENTYSLFLIKQGQLQIIEDINVNSMSSDSEIEDLIEDADKYYLVDDVYVTTDDALRHFIKLGNIL